MDIAKYIVGGLCVIAGIASYKEGDGNTGNKISNTILTVFGLTLIFY